MSQPVTYKIELSIPSLKCGRSTSSDTGSVYVIYGFIYSGPEESIPAEHSVDDIGDIGICYLNIVLHREVNDIYNAICSQLFILHSDNISITKSVQILSSMKLPILTSTNYWSPSLDYENHNLKWKSAPVETRNYVAMSVKLSLNVIVEYILIDKQINIYNISIYGIKVVEGSLRYEGDEVFPDWLTNCSDTNASLNYTTEEINKFLRDYNMVDRN